MALTPNRSGDQTPPAIPTPIDASSSDLAVAVRNFGIQLVIAAGAIIAFLGLPESSWVVRTYHFVRSDEFKPVGGVLVLLIASGWQLYKVVKRHRERQVLALLPTTPNGVAIGPEKPSAAVEKAVEAAKAEIAFQSAPPVDLRPRR